MIFVNPSSKENMRAILVSFVVVLALLAATSPARATEQDAGAPAAGAPKGKHEPPKSDEEPDPDEHIPMVFDVGFDIARLSKLDVAQGTFEADFLVSYHCKKEP